MTYSTYSSTLTNMSDRLGLSGAAIVKLIIMKKLKFGLAVLTICSFLVNKSFADHSETFLELCGNGTAESVEIAINKGADVNAKDADNLTALMYAARYNNSSVVITKLMEAGAAVNAKNNTDRKVLTQGGFLTGVIRMRYYAETDGSRRSGLKCKGFRLREIV